METYHVDDTYPPIDVKLERGGVYVDPTNASQITVNARINGVHTVKLSSNLSNNVSTTMDQDGYDRVRIRFVDGDLDTAGIYQLQVILTWEDGTETTPDPHEFKVISKWT